MMRSGRSRRPGVGLGIDRGFYPGTDRRAAPAMNPADGPADGPEGEGTAR